MIIIFMKCLYLPVYNSQPWVSHETLLKNLHSLVKPLFTTKTFVIQFSHTLCFVCRWIYRVSYLYYALFAVIISLVTGIVVTFISNYFTGQSSKRSCLSQPGKKPGISNRHFFLADMNTPDDFDKKFVHRWVDRVFCYLPLGCQKVNRLQRYVSLHYVR